MNLSTFHVVTCVSNPQRYQSRYRLYREFADRVQAAGVQLTTAELAFGRRPFEVTTPSNPRHVQLRTTSEVWHKENLLNLAIQRLPADWQYVAWVDADVAFARPDWALETVHQLQHYDVVQMFSQATDLSPVHEPYDSEKGVVQNGFAWSYRKHLAEGKDETLWPCFGQFDGNAYSYWHPGFAWAARREAIDHLGGLLEFPILGAADHHMAWALIGHGADSVHSKAHPRYRERVLHWQDRAEKHIRRNLGFVSGLLLHYWHGRKANRKYRERWDILVQNGFHPDLDLKKDWQGLWQLTDRSIPLRDQIRDYFRQRNEDGIDL